LGESVALLFTGEDHPLAPLLVTLSRNADEFAGCFAHHSLFA
jgi:hypothetical protein